MTQNLNPFLLSLLACTQTHAVSKIMCTVKSVWYKYLFILCSLENPIDTENVTALFFLMQMFFDAVVLHP